ncbi:TetR/AcrR family transcriptional regulator [Streptomyces sp. bgisy031]|uniref:TetR/AcrR family transcriptional regulator n=1 Tax=Streptomyces sp. bgisy031 TaxID=3413772 RepID=UPI003D738251
MAARRPPNRKAQIRSAAAQLFLQRGYHNVSMADVATALEITPGALYHHYRNKQDLLLHTVLEHLDALDALARDAAGLDQVLRSLAALAVGTRGTVGVWEREARYLDAPQREIVRARIGEVAARLAPLIQRERPELAEADALLLSAAALGVLGSRSRHLRGLSRRRGESLMYRLASAAVRCDLPEPERDAPSVMAAPRSGGAAALRRPRRDQLLATAVRLFDERGFHSVTMADIGEAAGIAASGIYHHFPDKRDILVTAAASGEQQIRTRVDDVLARAQGPWEALELLLRGHIAVCVEHRNLIGILTNDRDELPEKEQRVLRRFLADYLAVWVEALAAVLPGRDTAELRIAVSATQSMIYYVARADRIEQWPDVRQRLARLGMAVLLS